MQKLLLVFALMVIVSTGFSADFKPYFHKVKAQNGDAISTLLNKYDLDGHDCNVNKFYELNKMKKGSKLFAQKEYFLPIKVFKYNGKSIRTTLSLDDINIALEIQAYNESLIKKGLRKESFEKSKKLWVPFHKLNFEITDNVASDDDEEKVVAKKKDRLEKTEVKKEKEITDKSEKNKVKASSDFTVNELFGEKYKDVNMFGDELSGQVFYISSGHGGPDPGAQCTDLSQTLCEDEYAYDVALRLARDLTQHGATVHMIVQDANDGIRDEEFLECDYDEKCNGKELPFRQLDRLKQRADAINRLYKKIQKERNQKANRSHGPR